ncbi:hypothetical protein ACM66B_007097 [Microbotryomycetes sp. NB124-2]
MVLGSLSGKASNSGNGNSSNAGIRTADERSDNSAAFINNNSSRSKRAASTVSGGAASNLDESVEDYDKFWSDLDEAGRALKQRGVGLVNYNLEDLPAADLAGYANHAGQLWTTGFMITCTVIMLLVYLKLNRVLPYVAVTVGVIVTRKVAENSLKDFAWDVERKRGTNTKSAFESIEWLNATVGAVWSIIDPDLFTPAVDLIEDAMKALSPAVVRSVRITSIEHGTNSIRLLGLRHLPEDMDIAVPLDEGTKKRPTKQDPQMAIPDPEKDEGLGKFINLECTFAYRRIPKPATKSTNAHFIVHLGLGVRKLVKVEVPVLVELSGLHGIIRLRLEMVPEPPFVRHIKFSFPRVPKVEIVAKPLGTLDVMTLPGVSSYVLASIDTVLNYFTAPKSYTIDATRFVLGSDVALRTRAVGILCVVIHSARNLLASDLDGRSDGYCEISYAHVGKVLYRTKVYPSSLHPMWEEMCFCLIGSEELDEDDSVRITVWDHDRFTTNDMLGSVIIPLNSLHDKLGVWRKETVSIEATRSHRGKAGTLSYSAAFFPLAKTIPPAEPTDGKVQDPLKRPSKKPRMMYGSRKTSTEGSVSNEYAQRVRDMLDSRAPANTAQPTGIVSFQIHQMSEVEAIGDRSRLRKDGSTAGSGEDMPSTYVNVFLNDEKVFQTRMKPLTATPYFNASSESIVRDWRAARLDFAVMDYHDRHHDTLIGFVSVHLGDILSHKSQVTKWAPIVGGAGHGRLRFSILFKPLDIQLPKPLLEWNIGCLEIVSARAHGLSQDVTARLHVKAEGRVSCVTNSDLAMPEKPNSSSLELNWVPDKPLRIPVLSRTAPVVFHIESVRTIQRNDIVAYGALWFGSYSSSQTQTIDVTLIDHEFSVPQTPPLPQLASKKRKRDKSDKSKTFTTPPSGSRPPTPPSVVPLEPKRSNSSTNATGAAPGDDEDSERPRLSETQRKQSTPIGVLTLTVKWRPGLSSAHRDLAADESSAARAAYQLWLHRNSFKKSEKKRKKAETEVWKASEQSWAGDGAEWVEEDDLDEERDDAGRGNGDESNSDEDSLWLEEENGPSVRGQVKQQVQKMKPKAGTVKWMAHGVKVASRKVVKGVSQKEPKPLPVEQEGMSSF